MTWSASDDTNSAVGALLARHKPARNDAPTRSDSWVVRELDNPYRSSAAPATVATPSCCCCCCCLTALIVIPVYTGVSTARTAQRRGKRGMWPGLLIAFAIPIGALLFQLGLNAEPSARWPMLTVSVALGFGAAILARRLVGDGWGVAIGWAAFSVALFAVGMVINFFVDILLFDDPDSMGILIEILLIPVWIWMIVRRRRPPESPPPAAGPTQRRTPTIKPDDGAGPSAAHPETGQT